MALLGCVIVVASLVSVVAWRNSASAGAVGLPRLGSSSPVEDDDVGDPYILTVSSDPAHPEYVLFWTTDWRSNVPTAVSSDLVHWHRVADALPELPVWATRSRTMTWGPSAERVGGGWVLYFSTEEASSGLECIGAAFSSTPTGPYVDRSPLPMMCQRSLGGSIDPSVVHAPNGPGKALVWKSDGNARNVAVSIWEAQLAPGGMGLVGTPHRLLGATEGWERGIVEGPAMLADTHGGWWLLFSGGAWQSNTYDTGVAWCPTLAGPCHSAQKDPFLTGTPEAVSPGGLDTFLDAHHQLWASYSAFPSAPSSTRAAMAEDRVLEIAPILSH